MSQTVNIQNREELRRLLLSLTPETKPEWGRMTAQQMIEHLVEQVEYTNGTRIPTCDRPPEEALKRKQLMLTTDAEIPKNMVLNPPTDKVRYGSMDEAVIEFMNTLADFDRYFEVPGATAIHGGFGPMNHEEWLIRHNKHFTHHFKQFGLVPNLY